MNKTAQKKKGRMTSSSVQTQQDYCTCLWGGVIGVKLAIQFHLSVCYLFKGAEHKIIGKKTDIIGQSLIPALNIGTDIGIENSTDTCEIHVSCIYISVHINIVLCLSILLII